MFAVITNPSDIKFAVTNQLTFAVPCISPHNFFSIVKELNRDGFPYCGGANINIGGSEFKIFYPA